MHQNRLKAVGISAAGAAVVWGADKIIRSKRGGNLEGQTALVTGGSRGLGLAIARELSRQGCRVAICARSEQELEACRTQFAEEGVSVRTYACDVADPDSVDRMFQRLDADMGPLDILVNNAGMISVGPLGEMKRSDYRDAMESDFWGAVHCVTAALPGMRKRRSGRIVNISSIGGRVSVPHLNPYCCAKFALTGYSEGLRAELAKDGISVTTILPGLMRTGSYVMAFFKGQQEREFDWFSVSDNAPLLSISAQRAARSVVRAAQNREAERVLSVPARIATFAHGVAPGLVTDLLGAINVLLPRDAPGEMQTGKSIEQQSPSRTRDRLTSLGKKAQAAWNQR